MFRKIVLGLVTVLAVSCSEETVPNPYGELRLEYPKPQYKTFSSPCGYSFEYSDFAKVNQGKEPCWYYIDYPKMNAKVFITYFPIRQDFDAHVKEAEKMVYEHTVKASAIDTKFFEYPEHKVFGNFYELKGQSASNIQFYATDSTKHFITANLYFNTRPKPDSLAPAISYIKSDSMHMLDSFEWKSKELKK